MAYFRTVIKGNLGSVETFTTSTNWGIFGLSPDSPEQIAVDGIATRLRSWITAANVPSSLESLLSTQGELTTIRVEKRAEDETILSISEQLLVGVVTGTGSPTKTPQDALVLSLRTNTPGARGRGRMYWPALGATISSAFQLTVPTAAATVADWKTFLAGIGNEMNQYFIGIADARRVVLSVRSVTDHVNRDVVSLQVGNVLDTQRRRRDAIPESYSAAVYP